MNLTEQFAALLRITATEDLEKSIRGRLYGMGIRETCTRCGGSGKYSFNMIHGDRCYGCNGRGDNSPKLSRKTLARATAAVEAGDLDAYLERRKVKAEALRAIKPLAAEIRATLAPIGDAYTVAYRTVLDAGEFLKLPLFSLQRRANRVVYTSLMEGRNYDRNPASASVCDVESAIKFGHLDPEHGAQIALLVLQERLAEARAIAAEFAAL